MKKHQITALCIALSSAAALAQDTVFGLSFNQPIDAPECPHSTAGGKKLYRVTSEFTCAWSVEQRPGDPLPSRTVVLESKSAPPFMKGLFKAYIKDDLLVGVRFYTYGIRSQEETYEQLKQKYGEPTTAEVRRVQNLGGAVAEAIRATWKTTTVVVNFDGVADNIDLGEVTIDTSDFYMLRIDNARKSKASQIKL